MFDPTRRDALKSMAVAFSLLAGAPALLRSESFSLLPLVHDISEETLSRFDTLTTLCWKLLKGNELSAVQHLLFTFLPEIEMLAQQPSAHQKAIACFAAQAHIIKSLVVGHQDNLQAKLTECRYAIDYSRMAHSSDFEIVALIQQAVAYDYQKQYARSFKVYQQASTHLEKVTPLLQARVLAGLAGAYARNGQQEYKAQHYLERAREVMPSQPEADPSFLYADCGRFTVPLWEGRIYFDLDQYDKAFSVFDQLEIQKDAPERIRTEFLNHALETSIVCGDLEQSLACLRQAGKAAIDLKSDRRQREVADAGQMMLMIWRSQRKQIRETMTEVFTV